MSKPTQFTLDVALTFMTRVGSLVVNALSGIVVARWLGPANKGLYVLTFLPLMQFTIFGYFGFTHALVYFMGSKKITNAEALGHYLFCSALFSAILAGPYLFIINHFHNDFLKGVDLNYLRVSVLFVFPSLLTYFAGGVMRGINRVDYYNLINVFDMVTKFILVVTLIIILKLGFTGAVYGGFLGTLLVGIFSLVLVLVALRSRPRINPARLQEMIIFGLKSHLSGVFQFTERKIDMFMLNYFLPAPLMAAQVGFYSLAVSLSEIPRNFSNAVSTALLPKISSSSPEENLRNVQKVSRNVLAINLFFSLGLALLGYPVIYLFYGKAFLSSYLPFLMLLPGVIMSGLLNVFQPELVGTGSPLKMSAFSGLTLTLNFVLNLFLIPTWGIVGAAATSGLTYSLIAVLLLADYRRRHPEIKIRNLILPAREDLIYYVQFYQSLQSRRSSRSPAP